MVKSEPVSGRSELSPEVEPSVYPIQASTTDLEGFFEAELPDNGRLYV